MKKILLLICLIFSHNFLTTNANWYWNTPVGYWAWVTECPADGDTFWWYAPWYNKDWAVTNNSSSLTPSPWINWYWLNSWLSNSVYSAPSWTMYCLKWDWSKPNNPTTLNYIIKNSDWSNCNLYSWTYYCKTTNVTISSNWWVWIDRGGSWIKDYELVLYKTSNNSALNTRFIAWNSDTLSFSLLNNNSYWLKIRSRDKALNISDSYLNSSVNIFIDTVVPNTSDIVFDINQNLLANNNYPYSLSVWNNWGSPIIEIKSRSENHNNYASYTNRNSINWNLDFNWDISLVDDFWQRLPNWSREYSLLIDKICDAALNCYNWTFTKNHNVYSNTLSVNPTIYQELTSNKLADWTSIPLNITLKDIYWNIIIPSSGIWRTISMKFNSVTNNMFLNQYSRNWARSVDFSRSNLSTFSDDIIWNKNYSNENSTDWTYRYNFKFYTPTANSYSSFTVSDPNAEFVIWNISFDVTWSIWSNNNISIINNLIARAKSVFNIELSGDINDNWLRAQSIQSWKLELKKESTPAVLGAWKISLKFSEPDSNKYKLKIDDIEINKISITDYIYNLNVGIKNFDSYLSLVNPPAPSSVNWYLSTHISYTINWKSVIINSDVIWRDSYHWSQWLNLLSQSWLKVVWKTYSDWWQEVVFEWESQEILWKIDKIDVKTDVISKAYDFAKKIKYNSVTDNSTITSISWNWWGKRVWNIIYMWDIDNWGNNIFQLWNWSSINVDSTKTILIIWGNLYIKSNMYYSWNHNLWIVVLKDKAWNGWNIYIDPSVTNIVWTIFAEKALISYKNWAELDWSTNAKELNNQLHIFWSVFSYNTIGWSSKSTLSCPYYEQNCDINKSLKYDLNYLRKYFLIKDWTTTYLKPAYNWKVSWWWTYNWNWTISWNNPNYSRKISNTSDSFAKYPLVIEYNPNLKIKIPPFF